MYKSKSRAFISIILTFLTIMGIMFRPISSMTISAAEDYRLWKQNDSRWGSVKLGSSSDTMARSGCLVTSIAILAVHSGTKNADNFNPGTFVESLNSVDAFNNYGGIASYAKITEVLPDVQFVQKYSFTSSTQNGKISEMQTFFDKGYYIVCNVGNHWVFIEGISGSDVYMIDPAKDSIKLFDAYSNSSITELRVFTGKNPSHSSLTMTTTQTTVTTTTTTTSATTTTITTPIAIFNLGEYYNKNNSFVEIYSSAERNSSVIEYLYQGQIVEIKDYQGNMGYIELGSKQGWINLNQLVYAGLPETHNNGDINNDGNIDKVDLALLNEFMISSKNMPEGISILRKCEIEAADINKDGVIDSNDVLDFLLIICK